MLTVQGRIFTQLFHTYTAKVNISLDQAAYSVSEEEGSVEICASVTEPSKISDTIITGLSAMSGTADGE